VRAELVADVGERALSRDFFRSAEFHSAEGITHSLVVEDRFAAALVVREIPGGDGLLDASSAYGYPGALTSGDPLDPAQVDWSATGLVSAFLRDALGRPVSLLGATLRSEVHLADPREPLELRSNHARHIRRNERIGYTTGDESGPEARAAFEQVYSQTMARTDAAERYLYSDEYFERVLASDRAELLLTRAPDGRPAAGAIVAESDGMLHYFLGGTADELLEHSPFKSTLAAIIELARERGLPLNLGGGVRTGDALDHFKQGFANAVAPFHTHELICDPRAYERLSAGRPDGGFFPLYRS
jgi:Acetyltransferase (GNAT) domain